MCDAIVFAYHYNPIEFTNTIPYTVSLFFILICPLVPASILLSSAMVCMHNPSILPSLSQISFLVTCRHSPYHTIYIHGTCCVHLTLRVQDVYSLNFSQAHLTLDVVAASTPSFELGGSPTYGRIVVLCCISIQSPPGPLPSPPQVVLLPDIYCIKLGTLTTFLTTASLVNPLRTLK